MGFVLYVATFAAMNRIAKYIAVTFILLFTYVNAERYSYVAEQGRTVASSTASAQMTFDVNTYFGSYDARNQQSSYSAKQVVSERSSCFSSGIWGFIPRSEMRMASVTGIFIHISRHIYPSLPISELIFPFNYFW